MGAGRRIAVGRQGVFQSDVKIYVYGLRAENAESVNRISAEPESQTTEQGRDECENFALSRHEEREKLFFRETKKIDKKTKKTKNFPAKGLIFLVICIKMNNG